MHQVIEFLQSESWLALQEAAGKKTLRFSENGFSANAILHELPLVGPYLYVPRGPIIGEEIARNPAELRKKLLQLIEMANEKDAKWIRLEPESEKMLQMLKESREGSVVKAPHDTQPREILVADIAASEAELLAIMKPKTRYNIRLAEKRGVKAFPATGEKYEQAFLDLMQETADRKEITAHPRAYYQRFLTALPPGMCQLFVAEYEGEVLAANLLILYGKKATYLHGGSSSKHRDRMAPYLLQWEQIRYARNQGCLWYDFGGVSPEKDRQREGSQWGVPKSWAGITRFKRGFVPRTEARSYPGTYDLILHPSFYRLYRHLRLLQESFRCLKKFLR